MMSEYNEQKLNELRERFEEVDTANVADVMDSLGYCDYGLSHEFRPFTAEGKKIAGWAYTIRGQMSPFPQGGDKKKMQAWNGIGVDRKSTRLNSSHVAHSYAAFCLKKK